MFFIGVLYTCNCENNRWSGGGEYDLVFFRVITLGIKFLISFYFAYMQIIMKITKMILYIKMYIIWIIQKNNHIAIYIYNT